MPIDYVHGYSARERTRLTDQATTLTELLHADTRYPPGSQVLEAGCGVGAQTVILAGNSPQAAFTAIDISEESLAEARRRVRAAGLANVTFRHADLFDPPFPPARFDHVFVCLCWSTCATPPGRCGRCCGCCGPAAPSPSSKATTARPTSTPTATMPAGPSSAWSISSGGPVATP